ncbi:MAG: matrixin family metalloprotease [Thiomicrorhabdus sp.]|nr:matrixin family metalloprotease [Thiomicrorhabdus sp.]MCF6299320.1 matrixin family metalloprotease [Thiomicrorhabdus sp.]
MKLLIISLLLSMSSLAQAFTTYDLYNSKTSEGLPLFVEGDFVENENIPTWGVNNRLGDGASISYSFADWNYSCGRESSCFSLTDFMPTGYQEVIGSAFDAWADVSNLSFNQVADQSGDIVLGGEFIDGVGSELAHAGIGVNDFSNGTETISYISSGFVHFDSDEPWSLDGSERDLYSVALHEIGHALGLDHSDDSSALMYRLYTGTNSLQEDDIAGIQYLYGASVSPVPEASTYLMFLLGLAMVAGYGRRAVTRQV